MDLFDEVKLSDEEEVEGEVQWIRTWKICDVRLSWLPEDIGETHFGGFMKKKRPLQDAEEEEVRGREGGVGVGSEQIRESGEGKGRGRPGGYS